jgi:inner membrane transporter RhtA
VWPPLAFAGVLLVTRPWAGLTDAVGIAFALTAGICWGVYILLTQRIGQRFHGVAGLAVSMPVAALATTPLGIASAHGNITPLVLLACLGLALLLPVIPYTLELLALRRLDAGTFGTLMAVEPAAAALVGAVMLRQIPGWGPAAGIALVTIAAIGAARTGRGAEPSAEAVPAPG